jgi:hypothetical protein
MIGRRLWFLVGFSAFWWFTAYEFPIRSGWIGPSLVSTVNLKQILTTWIIQQYEDRASTPFNRERARQNMQAAYSAFSEYSVGRIKAALTWWSQYTHVCLHLLLLILCLTAIAALWRGRVRRASLAGLVLVILIVGDGAMNNILLNAVLPGGYAFLDDYTYLPGTDLMSSSPQRGSTIAAYERKPSGSRRVVGFADGHVVSMWDEKFVPLLAAQGHTLEAEALPAQQP